ncbi:hypothetical protein C9374_003371 [Naegleria lovaniensis]|uniref:Uncharacterized protein n=1 Tax=Naegleria lovaniensis TaxID=51637 RepID=A0AA88KLN6_NAELO|nr:uncharacterized protein C9374_003371 [Naegleria lovaniensis]KAG2385556.1 hypothetical protein C9374_003371 [Naegleria lovaniensis]
MNHQQESQTTLASSNELLLQTASTMISATRLESSSILTPSTSAQLGNMSNNIPIMQQKTLFRVPMDKLFSIPLESLAHKPQLYQFIIELRSRYVQHLLRSVSSPSLHELKKQDNEIFCNHVDEIVKETESLVEDMNFEEYLGDLRDQSESTINYNPQERRYYTTMGRMQLMNLAMKSQRTINSTCFAPSTQDHRPAIQYSDIDEDDDECEDLEGDEYNEDEFNDEELMEDDCQQHQPINFDHLNENSTNRNFDFSSPTFPFTNSVNTTPNSPKPSPQYSNTANSSNSIQIDPIKTEEISRQIQNAEPIQNGSLCFNQHHHIVVGKYDKDLLVKENRLKCCAMKKSTITIYAEKKNSRNGKIMKRERKAKSLLRFYRINVDFNVLVDTFLQKQLYQQQQPNLVSLTSSITHPQRKH